MVKLRAAVLSVVFSFVAFSPLIAGAASATFFGPIVSEACKCPGSAPGWGCILQTIQNVMNLGISLSVIIATIIIAYAGFLWILSPSNAENVKKGRGLLTNAVIGMVIVLSAWLVVDFVMKTLYDSTSFGPWNAILLTQGGADSCLHPKGGTLYTDNGGTVTGTSGGGTTATSTPVTSGWNLSKAIAFLNANAEPSSTGYCALYVREALAAGGLTSFNNNHPGAAYEYGPYLSAAGFQAVASGITSTALNNYPAQAGDIIVFQPVPKHKSGHITMYNGSQWVSDYKQKTPYSSVDYVNNGGSYTIYRR